MGRVRSFPFHPGRGLCFLEGGPPSRSGTEEAVWEAQVYLPSGV